MAEKAKLVYWHKLRTLSSDGAKSVVSATEIERDEVCLRPNAVRLLNGWKDSGWGGIIVGRRGYDTRFLISPAALKALKVKGGSWPEAIAELTPEESPAAEMNPIMSDATLVAHRFLLRAGMHIELCLPADISTREAERLGRFVEALPL